MIMRPAQLQPAFFSSKHQRLGLLLPATYLPLHELTYILAVRKRDSHGLIRFACPEDHIEPLRAHAARARPRNSGGGGCDGSCGAPLTLRALLIVLSGLGEVLTCALIGSSVESGWTPRMLPGDLSQASISSEKAHTAQRFPASGR